MLADMRIQLQAELNKTLTLRGEYEGELAETRRKLQEENTTLRKELHEKQLVRHDFRIIH